MGHLLIDRWPTLFYEVTYFILGTTPPFSSTQQASNLWIKHTYKGGETTYHNQKPILESQQ